MQKVVIVGATSAIAQATAQRFAQKGAWIYLIGRNAERLTALVSDLKVRGATNVGYGILDVNDMGRHESVLDEAFESLASVDVALIAHGTLGDQKSCERSVAVTLQELNTNLNSVISLLTLLANRFEKQGRGTIAVISSVAGDRGRQSNYVYGTAKGGLSIFLQGMRNRLYRSGVQVLTIKPGFVDTPMTASFKKGLLWASAETVAASIENAIERRASVIYTPFWWRYVMAIIKSIPETIFKRLSL